MESSSKKREHIEQARQLLNSYRASNPNYKPEPVIDTKRAIADLTCSQSILEKDADELIEKATTWIANSKRSRNIRRKKRALQSQTNDLLQDLIQLRENTLVPLDSPELQGVVRKAQDEDLATVRTILNNASFSTTGKLTFKSPTGTVAFPLNPRLSIDLVSKLQNLMDKAET